MTEQTTQTAQAEAKPARNYDYTRKNRVSKKALPDTATDCTLSMQCPYNLGMNKEHTKGSCLNPRSNKKMEDSACHKIAPKALLKKLVIIPIVENK